MRTDHIIKVLDQVSVSGLSEHQRKLIAEHISHCSRCERAFQAAQMAEVLLRERAAVTTEVPPFFQQKVLARLREKQAPPIAGTFWEMWRAAGLLISSMTALVLLLLALSSFPPGSSPPEELPELAAGFSADPAEGVIFGVDQLANDEMTYDQVLAAIYHSEDAR